MPMDTATEPLVSIVTATRNRPQMLAGTLEAVARQEGVVWESIVVDDGSDAAALEANGVLVARLGPRFRLVPPAAAGAPGTGPAAARNRGVRAARGRYIAFCDDDDHWNQSDHLAVALEAMQQRGAEFYFTNMRGENGGQVTIPDWFPDSPQLVRGRKVRDQPAVHEVALDDLMTVMRHHYPHPNGCVVAQSLLDQVGLYWERVDICEDVNLVLRLADRAGRILYRPDCVVGFNVTPRDSAFNRRPPIERWLACVYACQHARALVTHASVRRCARAIEAWNLRQLAQYLQKEDRRPAARWSAWQALAAYPSLGNAGAWLRAMMRR
ncbi:MAG: glycosyltransferase [Phycisphaeraceae bacterium]